MEITYRTGNRLKTETRHCSNKLEEAKFKADVTKLGSIIVSVKNKL